MACRYTYQGKTYEAHEFDDVLRAMPTDIASKYMPGITSTPAAPFVTKTEAWLDLGLKRMIAYAVEHGYDKVAFVNGEQSADRYDLSKQVKSIEYEKQDDGRFHVIAIDKNGNSQLGDMYTEAQLEAVVGKEIANKIINGDGPLMPGMGPGREYKELSGLDLKVGGQGMKTFYDQIVPQRIKEVLKKVGGGKVEEVSINTDLHSGNEYKIVEREQGDFALRGRVDRDAHFAPYGVYPTREAAEERMAELKAGNERSPQLGFTITDSMREKVGQGLPLFSKQRGANESSEKSLEDVVFYSDVPNEEWLQEQIDYARSKKRNEFGVPFMGKTTGYFKGSKPVVPLRVLKFIDGERGEQSRVRNDDLEWLKKELSENGLKNTGVPYIEVGYDGVPWVSEGNHRIMAALALGWESMPVEIRYFDGGERVDGSLSPNRVIGYNSSARKQSATINVDGVDRPTTNSNGKPIAQTEEGLRNFWRWFGNSRVVDAEGRPLVVYHGTGNDLEKNGVVEFDPLKIGTATDDGWFGKGFYFAPTSNDANQYAAGKHPNVMPIYLRIENPFDWRQEIGTGMRLGTQDERYGVTKDIIKRGHDGVFVFDETIRLGDGESLTDSQWINVIKHYQEKGGFAPSRSMVESALRSKGYKKGDFVSYYGQELADAMPTVRTIKEIVTFRPEQAKSAIGNNGEFNPENPDIRYSIDFDMPNIRDGIQRSSPKISSFLHDLFNTSKTFNWWDKTLGTGVGKAMKDADYKPVFEHAQAYEHDTARFASESADLAPDLIPKMDTLKEAKAQLQFMKNTADFNAMSPYVWFGTLAGINLSDPENAHYLSNPKELISKYGDLLPENQKLNPLTDRQIDLLKQFNAATNHSLDTLAKTEMTRLAKVSGLAEADPELSLKDTASFYFDQVAGEMDSIAYAIAEMQSDHASELELLESAANDEASDADKRKTYAKLLVETKSRHKTELEPLMSKLEEFVALKNGFVGRAEKVEQLKKEGYAPLMRFGKYTVDVALTNDQGQVVKDNDGNEIRQFFGMFESESEANAVAREMKALYPESTVTQGIMSEYEHSMFKGLTPETAEAYARMAGIQADEAFQKYLKLSVANKSALKRLIHRKGIAGFSFDATRTLASFVTSNARAASANLHLGDMIKSVTNIPKHKGDVKDQAIELLDFVRSPQEKGLAVRSLMFFQFLGGSFSSAAVNLTQTFTTTLPYLSQEEFGGAKLAASEISKAMKLSAVRTFDKKSSTGDAELDRMLKMAEEEGIVSPHEIHMLRGEASRGASMATNNIVWKMLENKYPSLRYTSRLLDVASSMWGGFFSLAEQYNRQVSFIAAYNMAKSKGLSSEQAFENAKKAVIATQFDYSKSNRSNFGRGAVGATILTFKTFLINYLEFIVRLAKNDPKSAAIAVGVLFLLAGAQGMPGADDLDDVIDTLRQSMGYRGNSKEWKAETLHEIFGNDAFGKATTNFLLHGISAFLPLDISGRLSVGNIIPATGMLKKSDSDQLDDFMEIVGPVGTYLKNVKDFARQGVNGGNVAGAAADLLAPKAIADVLKAIDMYQTGAYRDFKGRKIVDADGGDVFIKAIGFQPNSVAEVRRAERMLQQDITLYRNVKSEIAERWSRGVFEHNPEKVAKAKAMLADWNEDNPDRPMAVKASQVQRRVQEMSKLSSERIIKAAPREIRGDISTLLKSEALQ